MQSTIETNPEDIIVDSHPIINKNKDAPTTVPPATKERERRMTSGTTKSPLQSARCTVLKYVICFIVVDVGVTAFVAWIWTWADPSTYPGGGLYTHWDREEDWSFWRVVIVLFLTFDFLMNIVLLIGVVQSIGEPCDAWIYYQYPVVALHLMTFVPFIVKGYTRGCLTIMVWSFARIRAVYITKDYLILWEIGPGVDEEEEICC